MTDVGMYTKEVDEKDTAQGEAGRVCKTETNRGLDAK
jgi:hypothetical protein